jgi:hypothetical protein
MGSACGLEQIGYQPGGNGDARGIFFIRAGIRKVWDHGVDFAGSRAAGDVEHDEKLHQVFTHRGDQGLDHVKERPRAGLKLDEQIVVAKREMFDERTSVAGDFFLTRCDLPLKPHIIGQSLILVTFGLDLVKASYIESNAARQVGAVEVNTYRASPDSRVYF